MDAWFWGVLAPTAALVSTLAVRRLRHLLWQDRWEAAREGAWAAVRRAL